MSTPGSENLNTAAENETQQTPALSRRKFLGGVGGLAAAMTHHSALRQRVFPAQMQGRVVTPDQFPDRGFFYRSDQFNFAKIGVPALYLDTGTDFIGKPAGWGKEQHAAYEEKSYHQPSDAYRPDFDLTGAAQLADIVLRFGTSVANSTTVPTWNPDAEFREVREKSLRASL